MSIIVKNGVLKITGAENKLRLKGQEFPQFLSDYTLIDIETTGLSPYRDRVTELGGIKVRNNKVVDEYSHLVAYNGSNKVPSFITRLNGITEARIISEGIPVDEGINDFRKFIGSDIIVGYNVNFDLNFVYDLSKKYRLAKLDNNYVDVLRLARTFYSKERRNRLIDCMQRAGIAQVEQHRGLDDSIDTKKVYDDFRAHFTPELLLKAQDKLKNINLIEDKLLPEQLGFYNPVNNKKIVLSDQLELNQIDVGKMINNMGGQAQSELDEFTNYLILGDHEFFDRNNHKKVISKNLNKVDAKIKCLSETFFLNMLDDWARS